MTAAQRRNKAQPAPTKLKSSLPIAGIAVGAVVVILIIAVMFAGGEQLGGAEFGEPEISGEALPLTLNSNPIDVTEDPAFGLPIPEVTGQDFDGNTVEIKGDEPTALLFVSHSCPHCQDEIPEVQAWLDAGGGVDGVEIITVSTVANSAASNWPPSSWLEGEGWEPAVIADDSDSSVFTAFGGQAIPYWVFVDGDGNVAQRVSGRMQIPAIEAAMQAIAE
jgi:thiol-disulfide isomerase/thioredoxin